MHGTTPPEPPQREPARGSTRPESLAGLQLPVNPELLLYVVVVLVIGLIVLVSDDLGARLFASALQWLTIGYLLSRGIAKASRVFEL